MNIFEPLKELFKSTSDDIKHRSRNPFILTFCIVWLFHNWKAVYSLFTLDTSIPLATRIEIISTNYGGCIWGNFFLVIWKTLCLLVLSYLVLTVTRFISNLFEHKVFPLTNSITDKKTVVDREKYERVKESMINYRKQVEVLEGQTIELSNLKKGLEKSLSDNIENLESHSHEVVIENLTKLIEVYDYLKTKNLLEAVRQPILQGKIDSLDFGTRNILFSIGLLINEQGFKNQSISPFTPFGQLFRIFIQELENTRKFENK